MKLSTLANITYNKKNSQYSLNLRSKQLKKIGIKPEQLLNLKISKNYIKKVKKEVKKIKNKK